MMTRGALRTVMHAAALAVAVWSGAAWAAPGTPVDRFDTMTQLVGTWRDAANPDSVLRVRFYLTAGGTVLVESWERNRQPHSLTLYHRDKDGSIVATHYCPQGNQPRLVAASASSDGVVRFAFRDATGLDSAEESHLVSLSFEFTDADALTRHESYRNGRKVEPSLLRLERLRAE